MIDYQISRNLRNRMKDTCGAPGTLPFAPRVRPVDVNKADLSRGQFAYL